MKFQTLLTYAVFTVFISVAVFRQKGVTTSLQSIHDCLKNVDEAHCLNFRDWFKASPTAKIALTKEEQLEVVMKYGQAEQKIGAKENCAIGAGYTVCKDFNFRAVKLFDQLQQDGKLDGVNTEGKIFEKIDSLEKFVQTFVKHFSQGANGEYVCQSEELFRMLLGYTEKIDGLRKEIGGHSAIWAIRGQMEHCDVYASMLKDDFIDKKIRYKEHASHLKLDKATSEELRDFHLVFEYQQDDEILGHKAPRSNRLYFVMDPSGGRFGQMESYHKHISAQQEADPSKVAYRHLIGGFQLLQNLSPEQATDRLSKMAGLWEEQRKTPGPNGEVHMFHAEFGHFSNFEAFQIFEQFAVRNADSLGMNEVEMKMLLDYWEWQDANEVAKKKGLPAVPPMDINEESESRPTLDQVLDETQHLFRKAKQRGMEMSRAHLHPHGTFLICYDRNKWADASEMIIKSSMVIPKYCARQGAEDNDWSKMAEIIEIPPIAANFEINGKKTHMSKDKMDYKFSFQSDIDNEENDIECYMQYFMKCTKIFKTAGMGDTISGTGMIYHENLPQKHK